MITKNNDINVIRKKALEQTFMNSKGKRVLIFTEEFPFLVIGKIKNTEGDYAFIDAETTHIDQLEGKTIRIHLDRIEVFYIEDKGIKIPKVGD